MDYLSHIRDALVRPLTSQGVEGVQHVVTLMDTYYLMREDFENIMEVSSWGGKPSPFSKLDPKVRCTTHCPWLNDLAVLAVLEGIIVALDNCSSLNACCLSGLCFAETVF